MSAKKLNSPILSISPMLITHVRQYATLYMQNNLRDPSLLGACKISER